MTILASWRESNDSLILAADSQELYYDDMATTLMLQAVDKFHHIEKQWGHLAWAWAGGSQAGEDFDAWARDAKIDNWISLRLEASETLSRVNAAHKNRKGHVDISVLFAAAIDGTTQVESLGPQRDPAPELESALFVGLGTSIAKQHWSKLVSGDRYASLRDFIVLLSGVAAIVPLLYGPIILWRLNRFGLQRLDLGSEFIFDSTKPI